MAAAIYGRDWPLLTFIYPGFDCVSIVVFRLVSLSNPNNTQPSWKANPGIGTSVHVLGRSVSHISLAAKGKSFKLVRPAKQSPNTPGEDPSIDPWVAKNEIWRVQTQETPGEHQNRWQMDAPNGAIGSAPWPNPCRTISLTRNDVSFPKASFPDVNTNKRYGFNHGRQWEKHQVVQHFVHHSTGLIACPFFKPSVA